MWRRSSHVSEVKMLNWMTNLQRILGRICKILIDRAEFVMYLILFIN